MFHHDESGTTGSIRSFDAVIRVLEAKQVPQKVFCCVCYGEESQEVGSISVRVTEGDFPASVRESAVEQFLKSTFIRPNRQFYLRVYSSRENNIVNDYGNCMRFVTDGHRLFIKGMWAYGRLEPCSKMTAVVEYV